MLQLSGPIVGRPSPALEVAPYTPGMTITNAYRCFRLVIVVSLHLGDDPVSSLAPIELATSLDVLLVVVSGWHRAVLDDIHELLFAVVVIWLGAARELHAYANLIRRAWKVCAENT